MEENQTALYYFFSTFAQVSVGVIGALFIFYQVFHSLMSSQIKKTIRQLMENCLIELGTDKMFYEMVLNCAPSEAIANAKKAIVSLEKKHDLGQESLLEMIQFQREKLMFEISWESIFMRATLLLSGLWVIVALSSTIPILFIPAGGDVFYILNFKKTIACIIAFGGFFSIFVVSLSFSFRYFQKNRSIFQFVKTKSEFYEKN